MASKLNKSGYEALIEGDLSWLLRQCRTPERDHIAKVLRASMDHNCLATDSETALVRTRALNEELSALHNDGARRLGEAGKDVLRLTVDLARAKERSDMWKERAEEFERALRLLTERCE